MEATKQKPAPADRDSTPSAPKAPLASSSGDSGPNIAAVVESVRERAWGMVRCLSVEINGDGVILSGQSNSFYGKQLAQTAAMQIFVGKAITNQIAVDENRPSNLDLD